MALVRTLPCLADPGRFIVIGQPDRPIAEVLPYLNALLPNVISYSPQAAALTLRRQPGLLTLYADRVMVTQVKDEEEGVELLAAVRDLLNQVWAKRADTVPQTAPRQRARPLDVYALLPGTNCRECGRATCMAFAFALIQGELGPDACPSLADERFQAPRLALYRMLGMALEEVF